MSKKATLDVSAASIVLLGDFSPTIFQPAWLASKGLIRPEEADSAKIEVIHPDVAVFSIEWASFQITRQRFQVATLQEPSFEALRDLVFGCFSLLEDTPILQAGFNRDYHYRLQSISEVTALMERLAPSLPWEKALGKRTLSRFEVTAPRKDSLSGITRVRVEPSSKVPKAGVYIHINSHIVCEEKPSGAITALKILKDDFERIISQSDTIAECLL